MKTQTITLAVAAASLATAHAAEPAGSALTLGDVVVRDFGGPLPSTRILTSVDVLGGDQVEDKNVMNSWELLGLMPGIQLTETRMGAESGKATFRAFNGEGYINGIKVLIDGIPSNVNSGNQRFIDMIFPLDIEYIEVVRGTNDPRYGLHNIGGNFNIGTRQGGNYTDARLTYGSFNTRELQAAIGRESNGFAQNYFLGWQASDGFRDHSASEKYSLGGKWFYTTADQSLRAGLTARLYRHEAEEPGYLTASELAASRTQSPAKNANDRSDRDMSQVVAHLDWRAREGLFFSNRVYYNRYEDDRRVTFTSFPVGNAPRQRRIWDETQVGLISTVTWRSSPMLTLDGGINVERQDNTYLRTRYPFRIPTDFDGPPARTQNDDTYTLNNVGAYVQAIVQATESLRIVPAYRLDRFSGESRLNATGATAPLQDYGTIPQPKLSAVYTLGPTTNLYANWGRTFQVLTGSREPAYLFPGQAPFRPSINTGKELGVKLQPAPGTEARIAAWQQDATDEVANMPSTGTTVGLGQTRRRGVDLQASSRLGSRWRVWFAHAYQEAKVVSAFTSTGVPLAGKEVFSTPRYISNIGVEYRHDDRWRFSAQGRAQGDYYIDDLNAQGKFGGFAVLDVGVRYVVSQTMSVDLQARNITDTKYEYVWFDNFFWGGADQPMFSPAPGRSIYLSLNLKL
jgi:iron complex outermembrane recepter protein